MAIRRLLADAALAGAVPVAGYILAYAYEFGYLSYFGVPFALARATPNGVLEALTRLARAGVPALLVLHLVNSMVNWRSPVGRAVGSFVRSSVFLLFLSLPLIAHDPRSLLWLFWSVAAYALMVFGLPWALQRRKGTFGQRLAAQEEADRSYMGPTDELRQLLGPSLFSVLLLGAVTLLLTINVGRGDAMGQKDFFVIKDTSMVVLRLYGDVAVVAPFSRDSRQIEMDFAVIAVTSAAGQELRLVDTHDLGPLAPAPQPRN